MRRRRRLFAVRGLVQLDHRRLHRVRVPRHRWRFLTINLGIDGKPIEDGLLESRGRDGSRVYFGDVERNRDA